MDMTKDEVTIRPVSVADGDNGLFDLLSQLTEAPKIPREEFARLVQRQNELDVRLTIVAVGSDGRILATGSVIIEEKFIRGGRPCAHIEDIVVDKHERGKHLGMRIIGYLVDFSKQRGCYKIILDCADSNTLFYEKCGFVPKERQMVLYL